MESTWSMDLGIWSLTYMFSLTILVENKVSQNFLDSLLILVILVEKLIITCGEQGQHMLRIQNNWADCPLVYV